MSRTVFEAFAATAAEFPDNAFICVPPGEHRDYDVEGRDYSYRETLAAATALATLYKAAGYGHGHRVAVLLEQRPHFLFHYLALNSLGVTLVPVNPDYRADELNYLFDHSEADLAVVARHRVGDIDAVAKALPRKLPVVDASDLPERLPGPRDPARNEPASVKTVATILYTSGTTGRPKGCLLSNEHHLITGHFYATYSGIMTMERGKERLINPLPLYHTNSLVSSTTAMMVTGGCIVLSDRFSPTRWWKEVAASRATRIHYLGIMPPLLLAQPETPEERAHCVKVGIGAGIEPALHPRFEQRFGFPLVEVWGMTETGRAYAAWEEPRMIDTRAFGRPREGMEGMIVDEQMNEVPRGTPGELVVRHNAADPRHGLFSGYLKNEAATEEAWRGGWFHTGDICTQDESGMFFFVDRGKNIIRRSGENIAGAEVEACLAAHPAVAQVAVMAVKDEMRDEEVLACVVPRAGHAPDAALAEALTRWCLERQAYYKAPGWVLFRDSLPTTGTQKVQKHQIFAAGSDARQEKGIVDLRSLKKRG